MVYVMVSSMILMIALILSCQDIHTELYSASVEANTENRKFRNPETQLETKVSRVL